MSTSALFLILIVLSLLGVATLSANYLKRQTADVDIRLLEPFLSRLRGWWALFTVLGSSFLLQGLWGTEITMVLFGVMSFWAMREFLTMTPTRPADHLALFCVLFTCIPVQYTLVSWGLYGAYSILIPTYAFLLVPASITLSGDSTHFLERAAKIDMGMLICVYSLSYAPALLTLKLPENSGSSNIGLLFFFVLMAQLSDMLQYALSQLPTKHLIAPSINSSKSWEGVLGASLSVMLIGAALSWATPFPYLTAGFLSLVICLMSVAGAMTLSAIKRDRGVRDYGTLIEGHGGILDRIDSICFAAPIFFHLSKLFLNE